MFGAVIGDISGSVYEIMSAEEDATLFGPGACYTAHSVGMAAAAQAAIDARDPVEALRAWLTIHRQAECDRPLADWALGRVPVERPEGGWPLAHLAPLAWLARSEEECVDSARRFVAATHADEEIQSAGAGVAIAIYMALEGRSPEEIAALLASGYGLVVGEGALAQATQVRRCMPWRLTAPAALTLGLYAESYEDALMGANLIGGDTDMMGSVAGALAEARHGPLDETLCRQAKEMLHPDIFETLSRAYGAALTRRKVLRERFPSPRVMRDAALQAA